MGVSDATFIGQVGSVSGSIVRVRLRDDLRSTLVMIGGDSYRVGQIGGFLRVPLGYSNLYAVCTQIGADAVPGQHQEQGFTAPLDLDGASHLSGFRWMTVVLFGEAMGSKFERGVGQYPTVGDEVHLVTNADLKVIYGWQAGAEGTIPVGQIAGATGISADVSIPGLVSRHSAVVGSTGSGKSNLVTVLLESVASGNFPSARVVVIDPHGEYASALGDRARVFRVRPNQTIGERHLHVPYWALPFSELLELTLGPVQPNHEASIRDAVLDMKVEASKLLANPPPSETLTADTPVPFNIKQLWYELDRFERQTFKTNSSLPVDAYDPTDPGDAQQLKPAQFPPASPYNTFPYKNAKKRNIERQLDLMRSRLRDGRFSFLFDPGSFAPKQDGSIDSDLDSLVGDWIGHDRPVSVFDMSELPSEVLPTIVGTMLHIIYDMLFWGQDLPVGGREQPLLVVIDEAHRFLREGTDSPAHRTLSKIAKEGRKYGTGLMLVTQRPSELDGAVLSQCGSLVALRLANGTDRSKVASAVPDDLGGLIEQLPSLRTGEGIFLGEVMPIPSRVRVRKALNKPIGNDAKLPSGWKSTPRPDGAAYQEALAKWRKQSTAE